jgi:mannose/fructose-specific phosphotransferase system component IIA
MVTHGDLGRSLRATAETIVGPVSELEVISNLGLSRESLCEAVEECLGRWGDDEGVVLTDIPGGSCTQAALLRARSHPAVCVVTGLNLPMLVDFLVNRGKYNAHDMAARLELKGKAAVRNLEPQAHPSHASTPPDEARDET